METATINHLGKWKDTAGRWADEPIGAWKWAEKSKFVHRKVWNDNVSIDARKIVATNHGRYTGMTWRRFLSDGKRISQFEDEIGSFDGTTGWTLIEHGGLYYITEGNHRSVISKFFAEEEGVEQVKVARVITFLEDESVKLAFKTAEALLLPGQELGVKSEQVSSTSQHWDFETRFVLTSYHHQYTMWPFEMAKFLRQHNSSPTRRLFAKLKSRTS